MILGVCQKNQCTTFNSKPYIILIDFVEFMKRFLH